MAISKIAREQAIVAALEFIRELFEAGYSDDAVGLLAEVIGAATANVKLQPWLTGFLGGSGSIVSRWAPAAVQFLKDLPSVPHFAEIARGVTAASATPEEPFGYQYWPKVITPRITYQHLEDAGYNLILRHGQPRGLALIGSSFRKTRGAVPLESLYSAIEQLPQRPHAYAEPLAARTYAQSALAFWSAGLREPAVRIGAISPAFRFHGPGQSDLVQMWDSLYDQTGIRSRVGVAERAAARRAGEALLLKGYPAEATRLQLDTLRLRSGDIEPLWRRIEPNLIKIASQPASSASPMIVDTRESEGGGGGGHSSEGGGQDAAPEFYFKLEGTDVYRDQVKGGSDFDLAFAYGIPDADVLTILIGTEVEKVRQNPEGELELYITVEPEKLELRKGSAFGTARFQDGKMVETVRFLLRARSPHRGPARIEVHSSVRAVPLYSFSILVDLVEKIDKSASVRRPIPLDLDELKAQDRAERDAQLRIDQTPAGLMVTFVQKGQPPDAPVPVPGFLGNLDTELPSVRDRLKKVAEDPFWNNTAQDLKLPSNPAKLREQMKQVLAAGSALHARIQETGLKPIIEKIDALPDDSKISIHTKTAFIPWEIMFTMAYDDTWSSEVPAESENYRPDRIWGRRFQIETHLTPEPAGEANSLTPAAAKAPRSRQPGPLRVVVAIGKTIAEGVAATQGAKKAVEWQRQWVKDRLAADGEIVTEKKAIERIFVAAKYPATFVHLLCHGQSKSSGGSTEDTLEFAKDYRVTPNTLITKNLYDQSPIIFLNSCSSGAVAPLSLTGFLTRFRKKQACGVIGALFPVPIRFASAFGEKLMNGYLAAKPIGEVLLDVRRSLLDEDNPLGLFYTLQCPLDILAPKGN